MNNKRSEFVLGRIRQLIQSEGMKKFRATLLAIGIGLVIGIVILVFSKPEVASDGIVALLFGGLSRFNDVLFFMVPVLMTGLSVGFAFKMGLFNIGASGQYTMGMFFTLYVAFMWPMNNAVVHLIIALLAGFVGGLLWGLIPGILKAFSNVNEVITSIMLNYIGMFIVDALIVNNNKIYSSERSSTKYIDKALQLAPLGSDTNVNIGLIIGIAVAIIIGFIMYKTTFGYELIATGHSKDASHYAGINYKRNTVLTMGIAGGLAGLGGSLAILAPSLLTFSSMTYSPINVIATAGFNGIAVSLLGNSNPFGIIFSALFISYIQRGGTAARVVGFAPEIVDVIIAIIIYFSAFALIINQVFGKFISNIRKKKTKNDEESPEKIATNLNHKGEVA